MPHFELDATFPIDATLLGLTSHSQLPYSHHWKICLFPLAAPLASNEIMSLPCIVDKLALQLGVCLLLRSGTGVVCVFDIPFCSA